MTKLNFITLTLCLLLAASISQAQNFQITGYGGYTFKNELSNDQSKLLIYDHASWGGTAGYEIPLGHNQSIVPEFLYNLESTEVMVKDKATSVKINMPLGIQYAQIGLRYVLNIDSSIFSPYIGISFGLNSYNPQNSYYTKSTGFGFGARLGCQFRITEPIFCFVQGQYFSASDPDFTATDSEHPSYKDISMIGQIGVSIGIGFRFGENVDY